MATRDLPTLSVDPADRPADAAPLTAVAGSAWLGRTERRVIAVIAGAWLFLLVAGVVDLRSPDALGASNRVSPDRAAFLSANVATLAGFAMDFAKPGDFSIVVRSVFVLQTIAGIVLALLGGGLLWARLLGRAYPLRRLTLTVVGLVALALVGGTLTKRPGEPLGVAAMRGVSALGCGGILFGDAPKPGWAFSIVLVPLSLLGALGVVVLNDVFDAVRSRSAVAVHTSRVLTLTATAYVVGVVALALTGRSFGSWPERLVSADSEFWSLFTWGLPVESFASGPALSTVLPLLLLGIGTAGSAGVFGLAWLITVPARVRNVILNGMTAQALLFAATLAALAHFEPTLSTPRRLLLATSAVMNLGVSHEPLSITGVGLLTLAAAMVLAKMLPLIVFASALRKKDTA